MSDEHRSALTMDMSRHLGRRALLRFTLPSIAMMILTSVYGVIDIFSLSFLPMGVGLYGSSLFTALGNGLLSAALAAVRTLGLEVGAVLLLPPLFGPTGIWFSVVVAETAAALIVAALVRGLGPRYGLVGRRPPETDSRPPLAAAPAPALG